MSRSVNRRHVLKGALGFGTGLMLHEVIALYAGVEAGILKKAYAASGDVNARAYVNIHLAGAPARWTFDQWLTPNASDPVLSAATPATWNPAIATAFNSNAPEYRLTTINGVRVPSIFLSSVAAPSGTRPMQNLLQNMAVIRGYNSLTDGHEINGPLQTFPDPAVASLTGLAADFRKDPIASVAMDFAQHPFKSANGKVRSLVSNHYGTGKSIGNLMGPFKKSTLTKPGLLKMDEIRAVIDQLYDQSRAAASQANGRSGAIVEQLKSARDLALLAAQDLSGQANTLYYKYAAVMNTSVQQTMSIAGFTESPITFAAGESRQSANLIDPSFDLRQTLSAATMNDQLILSFMLAEYCLTRGVTGSLVLGTGGGLLNKVTVLPNGATATVQQGSSCDQHTEPQRLATVLNAGFFRGLSAGLLELISVLKGIPIATGGTAFDQTVIHVTGDFTRSPISGSSADGTAPGTDHAFDGQVASVFSGMINGPLIVGNITAAGRSGYNGTWGIGAPVDFNGSSELLSPRHAAAAVAHLLGVANPWPFTHLVWELDSSGKLQRKVEAKIV